MRTTCRICGSPIEDVLDLGLLYPSSFVSDGAQHEKQPLVLTQCQGVCGLVQLRHTFPLDEMYRTYWYRSALNWTMVQALQDIVDKVESRMKLKDGDVVVDIGANDGTLLSLYKNKKLYRVGFDPARNLREAAEMHCDVFVNDYFSYFMTPPSVVGKVRVVTSIAMFYDLEDPNVFVKDVKNILADDGLWVIQMTDLVSMLKINAFDGICFPQDTLLPVLGKAVDEVEVGDEVLNSDGGCDRVTKTYKRDYSGELVVIKPRYLLPIKSTPEHPFLIVDKDKYRFNGGQLKDSAQLEPSWKEAKDIEIGDLVVVPRLKMNGGDRILDLSAYNKTDSPSYRRGLKELELNNNTAWMLGLYTAEGYTNPRQGVVCFTLHKDEIEYFNKLCDIFGGIGYRVRKYPNRLTKSVNISITCTALARAVVDWIGRGARNKHIPGFIFMASDEIKISYLKGLFDGDGWVSSKNKIELHTSSKVLAVQAQALLASMGIMVGICEVKPRDSVIQGQEVHGGVSWLVRGTSYDFSSLFGMDHKHNQKKLYFVDDDYIYVPVRRVGIEEFSGPVYNIETESHTYAPVNIAVHNCHEHLEYYSLSTLDKLLKMHGMKTVAVEHNTVNGGSIRVYVMKDLEGVRVEQSWSDAREAEAKYLVGFTDPLAAFGKRVETIRKTLVNFITGEVERGKTVYALGASTKGNTLLQYCGLDSSLITAAAEVNPDKFGLWTIGTRIPIMPEDKVFAKKPDYFLVLPWHFVDGFISKNMQYLETGGMFIVPMPKPVLLYSACDGAVIKTPLTGGMEP